MAGHSKWANIKHRKGAQDAKRGKLFTKLIREITTSAKIGADPSANPRLRTAIDKALENNMTRDTIDRAIKRGVGGGDDQVLEQICYEGYGPYGIAVMAECLTDNRNRTVSDVRHVFSKMGGNLGTDGSVAYLFKKVGQLIFPVGIDEARLLDVVIEAGADDIVHEPSGEITVYTTPDMFATVREAAMLHQWTPTLAEITMVASVNVRLDLLQAEQFMKMVEMLEDLDDVQEVYSNADIPEEVGKQLA